MISDRVFLAIPVEEASLIGDKEGRGDSAEAAERGDEGVIAR
jgi:hypothetical protein